MRKVPEALSARVAGGAATLCHVWLLTRADGVRLGFTDHDRALVVDGVTCSAASGWTAGAADTELSGAPGSGTVTGALDAGAISEPDLEAGLYDEKLLRHILVNLLTNALKYSPGGGEVRFEVRREEDDTVFRVRDHGIGIPPEEVGGLFESFHRASNVGDIPGTGLGLAIVKNAVDMHGGTIAVDSRPGEGTTFTVRVPRDLPAARVSPSAPAADPAHPN